MLRTITVEYIRKCIAEAADRAEKAEYEAAWARLCEAHILSQPDPKWHTIVHWHMLSLGCSQRSAREIVGQVARLILAAPGSLSGRYPLGNTGRSDVSMFAPMPVSPEIKKLSEDLDSRRQ